MCIEAYFPLLFVFFFGIVCFCEGSSIAGCSSSAHVLNGETATLTGGSVSVPAGYACINLSGSRNSIFDGSNIVITAAPGSFNQGVAVLINNVTNLVITNANFQASRVYVTNSVNVTITQCHFSLGGTGTTPGIWTNLVDGLVVTNNFFSGNATVFSNGSSNINVQDNTFTNVYASSHVLDLEYPYHFSVVNNTFTNTIAPTAICMQYTTTFTDSGGDVSGNSILGGTLSNPIYVYLYGQTGFTVNNNLLSGITGSCVDFYGFKLVGQDISTKLTFSNNRFENFHHPCSQAYVYPAKIFTTTIIEMNNNIFNNMTVENIDQFPEVSVVGFQNSNGVVTNLTITNAVIADQSRNAGGMEGIYIQSDDGTNTISIDGLIIQNLYAEKTPDCDELVPTCTSAPGWYVAGIYTTGNLNGKNILMSDFTAGDGGLISGTDTFTDIDGGSAVGVDFAPNGSPFVNISLITLQHFKGGKSGALHSGVTPPCGLGGGTLYYITDDDDYTPYNTTISPTFTKMELYDFTCGLGSCQNFGGLTPPANAATTFNRTSFTLTWSPIAKRATTNYIIDIVKAGSWTNVYNSTDISHTVSELDAATTYQVRLCTSQGSASSDYTYFMVTTNPNCMFLN